MQAKTKLPNIGNRGPSGKSSGISPQKQFKYAVQLSKQTEQVRMQRYLILKAQYDAAVHLEEIERYNRERVLEEQRRERIQQIRQDFAKQRNRNHDGSVSQSYSKIPSFLSRPAAFTPVLPAKQQPKLARNVERLKQNEQIYKGIPDGKCRQPHPPLVLSYIREVKANQVVYKEFCQVVRAEDTDTTRAAFELIALNGTISVQQASQMLRFYKGLPRFSKIRSLTSSRRLDAAHINDGTPVSPCPEAEHAAAEAVQAYAQTYAQLPLYAQIQTHKIITDAIPLRYPDSTLNVCINGIAARDRPVTLEYLPLLNLVGLALHDAFHGGLAVEIALSDADTAALSDVCRALVEFSKWAVLEPHDGRLKVALSDPTRWSKQFETFEDRFAHSLRDGIFGELCLAAGALSGNLFASAPACFAYVLARCGVRIMNILSTSVVFEFEGYLAQIWTDPLDFSYLARSAPDAALLAQRKTPISTLARGDREQIRQQLLAAGYRCETLEQAGAGICIVRASLERQPQIYNPSEPQCMRRMRELAGGEAARVDAIVAGRPQSVYSSE